MLLSKTARRRCCVGGGQQHRRQDMLWISIEVYVGTDHDALKLALECNSRRRQIAMI